MKGSFSSGCERVGSITEGRNGRGHRQLGLPECEQTRRQTAGNANESPFLLSLFLFSLAWDGATYKQAVSSFFS